MHIQVFHPQKLVHVHQQKGNYSLDQAYVEVVGHGGLVRAGVESPSCKLNSHLL